MRGACNEPGREDCVLQVKKYLECLVKEFGFYYVDRKKKLVLSTFRYTCQL